MDEEILFEGLSHKYRRYVLRYLSREGAAGVDDIVAQIAAWDTDGTTNETDRRDRIRANLYHNHLPTLAEVGLIEYDTERERVTPTMAARDLYEYLDLFDSDGP